MRTRALAFLLIFVVSSFGTGCLHAEEPAITESDHVIVYYFCTNYNCPRCFDMERWTKEVINTDFKDDSALGKITLKKVNIFARGNEHFMHDYELCTDSVVLVLIKGGKEVKFTNLARVWCNICCRDVFKDYIKGAISKYVKEL